MRAHVIVCQFPCVDPITFACSLARPDPSLHDNWEDMSRKPTSSAHKPMLNCWFVENICILAYFYRQPPAAVLVAGSSQSSAHVQTNRTQQIPNPQTDLPPIRIPSSWTVCQPPSRQPVSNIINQPTSQTTNQQLNNAMPRSHHLTTNC